MSTEIEPPLLERYNVTISGDGSGLNRRRLIDALMYGLRLATRMSQQCCC